MKFTTKEEREELILCFEEKAKSLTISMRKEIPEDTSIIFETVTEWDENSEDSGNILVAYIRQPHLLVAIQVMDKLAKRDIWGAGLFAWDGMILKQESSYEIQKYKHKIGLCGRLGQMLEISLPDVKKN